MIIKLDAISFQQHIAPVAYSGAKFNINGFVATKVTVDFTHAYFVNEQKKELKVCLSGTVDIEIINNS